MSAEDRLGDAIRELASGLAQSGRGSCRLTVTLPDQRGDRLIGGALIEASPARAGL